MNDRTKKIVNTKSRQNKTRSRIHGTALRPRMSVKVSNTNVSVQIIDDEKHITLVSASTIGTKTKGTMTEKASLIGEQIAKDANKKKIKAVVFDRGPKQYHGRIKALAEAARKNGLEF